MGAILTADSADLAATASVYDAGVPSLQYLNFFNAATALPRNLADKDRPATVYGSPTFGAGFLSMKGLVDFIETEQLETDVFTAWVVYRTMDTLAGASTQPMPIGTFNGPAAENPSLISQGVALYQTGATTARFGTGRVKDSDGLATVTNDSLVTGDKASWKMIEIKAGDTIQRARDLTNGTFKETLFNGQPRLRTSNQFRIGSGYSAFGGTCDIAFAAIASVYHEDAVGTALKAKIAPYLSDKFGIVI